MAYVFGKPERFAIEYNLLGNKYDEKGVLGESWGEFRLWVEGKDICQHSIDGILYVYQWNLFYIIDWFCDNIEYILGYDPFPLPVKGNCSFELIEKASNVIIEDDLEEYLWFHSKSKWDFRHRMSRNNDGTVLSDVYFRRDYDMIEASWSNHLWRKKGIEFTYPEGVYSLPVIEFRGIVFGFLYSIINEIEINCNNETVPFDWKKKLMLLQKP